MDKTIRKQKLVGPRLCPSCNEPVFHDSISHLNEAIKKGYTCKKCKYKKGCSSQTRMKISISKKGKPSPNKGKKFSDEWRKKLSLAWVNRKEKYPTKNETIIKLRNRAAQQPRRFGKSVDQGQFEMITKWNKLGFNFEINYKLNTNEILYFLDGYDKEKNIVFEYDGKYHKYNKQKDLIRQNKIIDILKPKKFWRYDAVNKQFRNVLESVG